MKWRNFISQLTPMNSARPSERARSLSARTNPINTRTNSGMARPRSLSVKWWIQWSMASLSCGRTREFGRLWSCRSLAGKFRRWCRSQRDHQAATVLRCLQTNVKCPQNGRQTDPNLSSCSTRRTRKSSDQDLWFFRFFLRLASGSSPPVRSCVHRPSSQWNAWSLAQRHGDDSQCIWLIAKCRD